MSFLLSSVETRVTGSHPFDPPVTTEVEFTETGVEGRAVGFTGYRVVHDFTETLFGLSGDSFRVVCFSRFSGTTLHDWMTGHVSALDTGCRSTICDLWSTN